MTDVLTPVAESMSAPVPAPSAVLRQRTFPRANNAKSMFCLICTSTSCDHLQRPRRQILANREMDLIRAVLDPEITTLKEVAFRLGISLGTMKIYISSIYKKLGWKSGGSMRMLVLWAVAHQELLHFPLPRVEQFTEKPEDPMANPLVFDAPRRIQ